MENQTINNPVKGKNFRLLADVIGVPKRHINCGFRNFEVTEENKKYFEICKTWVGENSITLTGKTGLGKTHLALAMLRNFPMKEYNNETLEIFEARKIKNILDTSAEDSEEYKKAKIAYENELYKFRRASCMFVPMVELFIRLNEEAMDKGKLTTLNKYSDETYDCICFDDLGAEKLTDAKRENLYYIIDSRYRNMLPTIVTSNFTINEINDVEPRIASRLSEMGDIIQLNGKDYRLRK